VLLRLAAEHAGARVSIGDVAGALGDRGIGVVILVLALPNIVPGPVLPGFSTIFGVPIALLSLRLIVRHPKPHLPEWLTRQSVRGERFRSFVGRAVPVLRRIERLLRPRPSPLTAPLGMRFIGVVVLVTGVILSLPVPFGNWFPGLAITFLALGLLEKDSRALWLGLVFAVLSWFWVAGLIIAGAELIALAGRLVA
jgi:hypothetical protein